MKIFAETERLILREIIPEDVNNMFELDSDPEVHKYLGNKPFQNITQSVEIIDYIRKQYVENGIGRWAIIEKNTNDFIGWTGLKFVTERINDHINFYDIGYRLIRRYWGKGYAKESALASLNYGFHNMNLETIYAAANIKNIASNKILSDVGFKFIETFPYELTTQNFYKLDKIDWESKNS
jgi:RimJ/RimL family protein N-acetyltransferase